MSYSKKMGQWLRERLALEMSDKLLILLEFTQRQQQRLHNFTNGFVLTALPPHLRTELTTRAYARQPKLDKPGVPSGLSPWEEELVSHLPAPPAKILLGGCGDGREARALAERGYEVIAFDPTPKLIDRAKTLGPADITYLIGSYEDLADPQTDRALAFSRQIEQQGPYDGVYLGWGSFGHIPTHELRLQTMKQLRNLCPTGPIVLTYVLARSKNTRNGRIWALGEKAGNLVQPSQHLIPKGDTIWARGGFVHELSGNDILAAAKATHSKTSPSSIDSVTSYSGVVFYMRMEEP